MNNITAWQNDNLMGRFDEQTEESAAPAEKPAGPPVDAILADTEAGFEAIFERYKLFVATVAGRYFRRPEEIEEVVQISFTKIYFELKNFQYRHDLSFTGWIGRITANVCLDMLRTRRRKPENLICELSTDEVDFLMTDTPDKKSTPENQAVERDLAKKLLACLASEDQAILQMLYEEEMSVGEVAEITGWSNSKIKVRAFRARRTLRKILKRFV